MLDVFTLLLGTIIDQLKSAHFKRDDFLVTRLDHRSYLRNLRPPFERSLLHHFEGTPFHPTNDRFWEVIQKYKVSKFYTAPTAIRALMKFGEQFSDKYDLSSLKILGTVGEPINPEAWLWYHKYVGREKAAIVDTYWQVSRLSGT